MEYKIEKITENKWFKLINNSQNLTIEEFFKKINPNEKLNILIQLATDESIGIYGILKNEGICSFTTDKEKFFDSNFKLIDNSSFILDDEQTIWSFLNLFENTLKQYNISLKKDVIISYYEHKIDKLLK